MPGLISHEWDDGEDEDDHAALPSAPSGTEAAQHPPPGNDQRFVVYVEGLPRLPSRFLRLDLGTPHPTVGRLTERLTAVTGLHVPGAAAGCLRCAPGGPALEGARRYLHRLRVRPGDVLVWGPAAAAASVSPGAGASALRTAAAPRGEEEGDAAGRRRRRIDAPPAPAACCGVTARSPGDAPAGPPPPSPSPEL